MLLNTQHVDTALVVGPNMRWALEDTVDLFRWMPEVLLGYRVKPTTLWSFPRELMGRRWPTKIVILDGCYDEHDFYSKHYDHEINRARALGLNVECWHVHRGEGIWRIW